MTTENAGVSGEDVRGRGPWYRLPLFIGGALGALALSFAAGGAFGAGAGPGGGCWIGGRFGHPFAHGHRFGAPDPETVQAHVLSGAEFLLKAVDATDDQKARVSGILAPLAEDLVVAAGRHRDNRRAFLQALASPDIDRQRLEAIRRAEVDLIDEATGRLVGALGELADVLTPEQRAKLVDLAHGPRH
jgi:Spy/CpxP family protein refolding chaperone